MKIRKIKKKCIILSLVLILAGSFISIVGFGVVGFNFGYLKKNPIDDAWYHTIHINNDNLWYGVDLGNNIHLLNIGDYE